MVCFVANEKSDHIHDMIMKQKKSKTRSARSKAKGVGRVNNNMAQRNTRCDNSIPANSTKRQGQQLSAFQSVNRQHTTKTPRVRDLPTLVKKPASVPPPLYALPQPTLYALPQPSGINLNVPQQKIINSVLQQKQYENHVRQITSLLKRQCHVNLQPPPPLPRQPARTVKFATESKTCPQVENKKETSNNIIAGLKSPKATKEMPIKLSEEVEDILLNMPKLRKVTNPIQEDINSKEMPSEKPNVDEPKESKCEEKEEIKKPAKFFDVSIDKVEDPDEAVPSFAAVIVICI